MSADRAVACGTTACPNEGKWCVCPDPHADVPLVEVRSQAALDQHHNRGHSDRRWYQQPDGRWMPERRREPRQ